MLERIAGNRCTMLGGQTCPNHQKGWKEAVMKPNIEKTRAYYAALAPEDICGCDYCRNYCARVREAYPEVARYLDSLGVDIEKPFEVFLPEPDEDGNLKYDICQYIVFGTCPEDYSGWIGDVEVGISNCHPSTNIEEEHFVLDVSPIHLNGEITEVQ